MQDKAAKEAKEATGTKLSDLPSEGPLSTIAALLAKRLAPDADAIRNADAEELCNGVFDACDELRTLKTLRVGKGGPDPKYDCTDPDSPIWKAAMVIYGIDPDYENTWANGVPITEPHLWTEIRMLTETAKMPGGVFSNMDYHNLPRVDVTAERYAPQTSKDLFLSACHAFRRPIYYNYGRTLTLGTPTSRRLFQRRIDLWEQLTGGAGARPDFRPFSTFLEWSELTPEQRQIRVEEWKMKLRRPIQCVTYGDVPSAVMTREVKWRLDNLPHAARMIAKVLNTNQRQLLEEDGDEGDVAKTARHMYALLWLISKLWEECLPIRDTIYITHREDLYNVIAELCADAASNAIDRDKLYDTLEARGIAGDEHEGRVRRLRELVDEGRVKITPNGIHTPLSPYDFLISLAD